MLTVGRTGEAFVGVGALGLEVGAFNSGFEVRRLALIGRGGVHAANVAVLGVNAGVASETEVALLAFLEPRGVRVSAERFGDCRGDGNVGHGLGGGIRSVFAFNDSLASWPCR